MLPLLKRKTLALLSAMQKNREKEKKKRVGKRASRERKRKGAKGLRERERLAGKEGVRERGRERGRETHTHTQRDETGR